MGMAASQARLLTITARIHDVEYQAQSIQNAKVQLATQSDQVYQDYIEALDATTLTVSDINGDLITATFNNLCGRNAVDSAYTYALQDSKGRLIVPEEIEEGYYNFKDEVGQDDPYLFALYMIGGNESMPVIGEEFIETVENAEEDVFNEYASNPTLADLKEAMNNMGGEEGYNELSDEDKEKYDALEEQYKFYLYRDHALEIYSKAGHENIEENEAEAMQDDFDYYVRMYRTIQASSGACISINDFNEGNEAGDAANNSEWLQNMIQCGKISVSYTSTDSKTGEIKLVTTSPSSDSALSYTTTTTIDKTALAKAEAEYEHATKEIDAKDKQYDMDLSKLETERTALTTEYDSVKKVIQDNIERTFGIFS